MTPAIGVDVLVSLANKLTAPLKDAENMVVKASERMNKRLELSMKLAGGGAAASAVAWGAERLVTGFTDSIREVERAKGELATLGVRDLDAVVRRGREMQTQLAGITADAFVRASYDIKSGISSLTDQGVADMTASAMLVAKATKGQAEQMTSLFATSYGIFKKQMSDLTDPEFGEQFGAALSASVQQFKTDGAKMQQAIESAGAGAVNAGMGMTEQLAVLGMMQQQMQAGEAGTALRAFAANAARAHEAFGKMRVTEDNPVRVRVLDENGMLRAMPDILADLRARYGDTLNSFENAEIAKAFGTEEAMKLTSRLYGQEAAVRANAEALDRAAEKGAEYTIEMAKAADSNWDATMLIMSQKADVLRQMIGERLLPVVERIAPVIDRVLTKAFEWIDANPQLVTAIGVAVAGLGAFAAIAAPVLLGSAALVSTWATLSFGAAKLAAGLLRVPGLLVSILNPLKLVRGALIALRFAVISTGIGAIAVGLAMAGVWIYKNWSGLSTMFGAFGKAFSKALGPAKPLISGVSAAVSKLAGWVSSLLGPVNASAAQWEAWGETAGRVVGGAIAGIVAFDWQSLLTLDGLRAAWASVSGFLGRVLGTVWDALNPLSWFGIMNAADLSAAWQDVTGFIGRAAGALWNGVTELDWGKYVPSFSWDGIVSVFSWQNVLTALDWATWLTPVHWPEFIPGFAWSSVIGALDIRNWLNFTWADVLPDWDWSGIIPDLPDFKSMFSDAGETIDVRLENRTSNMVGRQWQEGLELISQYRAGLIGLADVKARLEETASGGGLVFDGFAANRAQDMLALLQQLETAQGKAAPLTPQIENPETLLQAAKAAAELETRFPAISAAASEALTAVQAAITQALVALQSADFRAEGARLASSIAAGMRAQVDSVRSAAAAISDAIQVAIPRNARVNVALSGAAAATVQARASGGAYKPGWLLTGEQGPELRYATEGGFIAHNRALRGMVAMSERVRQTAAGIALPDLAPLAAHAAGAIQDLVPSLPASTPAMARVPAMAAVAGAGAVASGPTAQRGPVSYSPQFNMPMNFERGVEIDEVRAAVRQEISAAEERAQADLRRFLHD